VGKGPLLDEAPRGLRADIADDQLPAQVKLGLLALMLSVEVCGLVVLVNMRITMPKNVEMIGTHQSTAADLQGRSNTEITRINPSGRGAASARRRR